MTSVLYIINVGYQGGVEKFTNSLVQEHIKNRKFKPILLFMDKGDFYSECEKNYENCFLVPFKVNLSRPISILRFNFWLYHFLREHRIDLVHIAMPWIKIVSALALVFSRIPVVWFIQGPIGGWLDRVASLLQYEKLLLYSSKQVLEEYRVKSLLTLHLLKKELVYLMVSVNEPDHRRIQEIRNKWTQGNRRLWVSAGRICDWKGFDLIIKALAQLKNNGIKVNEQISLLIIGSPMRESDHRYYEGLNELIKNENLSESVQLIPFDSNWHDYLYASELFIHSARIPEPFGLVIVEALACGTLVVASKQAGASEFVNSPWLFNSCDQENRSVDELANILKSVIFGELSRVPNLSQRPSLNVLNSSKVTEKIESYYLEIIRL